MFQKHGCENERFHGAASTVAGARRWRRSRHQIRDFGKPLAAVLAVVGKLRAGRRPPGVERWVFGCVAGAVGDEVLGACTVQ